MKRILTVLTGGTIGSENRNGIIIPQNGSGIRCLELYRKKYGADTDFHCIQPVNILSENLNIKIMETVVNSILNTDLSLYDGVIITHGSDTLSYSSSMLSMCLCHLEIPVIITAANRVPDDERSNALDNIRAAVCLINEFKKGVFTVYKNEQDDHTTVYLPTRITEADRFCDSFSSFDKKVFGIIKNDSFKKISDIMLTDIYRKRQPVFDNRLSLDNNVMMIFPYPSLDYNSLTIDPSVKAVVHVTYHSSTVKTDGENSALSLLKKCLERNINMYLCSFKKGQDSVYNSLTPILNSGAKPLFDISNESAYCKLLLGVNTDNNTDELMNKNIYYEICR